MTTEKVKIYFHYTLEDIIKKTLKIAADKMGVTFTKRQKKEIMSSIYLALKLAKKSKKAINIPIDNNKERGTSGITFGYGLDHNFRTVKIRGTGR